MQHRSTDISPGTARCDNAFKTQQWIPLTPGLRKVDWGRFHNPWISAISPASPCHWNLTVTLKICLLLEITFKAFHCLWQDRVRKMLISLGFFPQSLSFSILWFGISFLCYIRSHIRNLCSILTYVKGADWQGTRYSLNSVFDHDHFSNI